MKVGLLARFTFREARRRRAVLAALILGVAFVGLFALVSHFLIQDMDSSPRMTTRTRQLILGIWLLMGLWGINSMGSLLAIFVSAGAIGGEVESGALDVIVPKPVRRWEIIVGKWLGHCLMVATYVAILSSAIIGVIYLTSGYLPPNPWSGVALMSLGMALLVSLTVLGSTMLSTMANGITIFVLFSAATIAGTAQQLGSLLQNVTLERMGIVVSWLIPSDTLWRMAAYQLQSSAISFARTPGPFTAITPPDWWMLFYVLLYGAACLMLAVYVFGQRDL